MQHWSFDAIFYHIYPLGLTGAPARRAGAAKLGAGAHINLITDILEAQHRAGKVIKR